MPIAIVTGGNSGIGRAIAVALAAAGHDVGFTWHDKEERAQSAIEEATGHGGVPEAVKAMSAARGNGRWRYSCAKRHPSITGMCRSSRMTSGAPAFALAVTNDYMFNTQPTLERPDLIVLDYNLPDLSGTDVARRLRQATPTTLIPVILVGERGDGSSEVEILQAGADDYVLKPYEDEALRARGAEVHRHPPPARDGGRSLPDVFGRTVRHGG